MGTLELIAGALFGIGFAGLAYSYAGYPLILALLARRAKPGSPAQPGCPSVAVLLSVYNEQDRIAQKIENFLALDYPPERLTLWIGSDGSTDLTAETALRFPSGRVRVLEFAARSGKTPVLNRLADCANAEILVFTDVNAMFRPEALRELLAPFADPDAGLVSGRTVSRTADGSPDVEGAYYRYEQAVKRLESRLGLLTGADGAIYAMRRSLYTELDRALINDFTHPIQAVLAGHSAVMAERAVCEESAGTGAGREYRRQVRMVAQAMYVYSRFIGKLVNGGQGRFAWMLTSHKLLRWMGPLWMLFAGSGAALLAARHPWALALLAPQAVAYGLAVVAVIFPNLARSAIFRFPLYFCVVNAAYFEGLLRFLAGNRFVTWNPRGS